MNPEPAAEPAADPEPAAEDGTEPAAEPADDGTEDGPEDDGTEPADDDTEQDDDGSDSTPLQRARRDAAKYRRRLRDTESRLESLQRELFTARVRATGRLADPTDMPFDPELLDSDDGLTEAIDALTEAKPHLKARAFGDIGQREVDSRPAVSIGSILRANA